MSIVETHTVKVLKLSNFDEELGLPQYESSGAAGADLKACLPKKENLIIKAGQRVLIPTGLAFEIPHGFEIQVRPRSGLSLKSDLLVVNSPGTIDCDYRGEIKIIMGNIGKNDVAIEHGQRVAQMVLAPIIQASLLTVTQLSDTQRGEGGFGHTGHK